MIINMSNFIAGIGGLLTLMVIIGAFVVFIRQVRRTEKGKFVTDKILLKLPIFGPLLNKVAVAKFTRTLGTLVSSGVPILDGLEITAKTSGNKVVEYAIMDVRKGVVGGKTLAEPITKAKVFPPMVTHMIAVGESTGALDAMLSKIADFYDDEVDACGIEPHRDDGANADGISRRGRRVYRRCHVSSDLQTDYPYKIDTRCQKIAEAVEEKD